MHGKQLFESGSASKSYNRAIQTSLEQPNVEAAMLKAGTKKKDVATHTFRKAPATHAAGDTIAPPSITSILLRGGWSIGDVLAKYVHHGNAQDKYLAHLLAGRDFFSKEFHQVCPHFITPVSDGIIRSAFPIATMNETFDEMVFQ